MAKTYNWRTALTIVSGGYPGEEHGVIGDTSWHSTDELTGSNTTQYYYRDSNSLDNANSSRVVITVTDNWTAQITNRNYLKIKVTTTIDSIVRDSIRGNPNVPAGGRNIFIRRTQGGANIKSFSNDNIGTAHTISGSIDLGEYSFTISPGGNKQVPTVWLRNNATGHDSDPTPSIYVDLITMGTTFQNTLPPDYRPGMALLGSRKYGPGSVTGTWWSHNQKNGAAHIRTDNGWREMRTEGGDSGGRGNPPLILRNDSSTDFYNMREIGKQDQE